MSSEKNAHQCLGDCLIEWHYGKAATSWPKPERAPTIRGRDLLPVPPPVNNGLYAYGDCLLGRGNLSTDGYAGDRHRQVFEETSQGKLQHGLQINHLCQRPLVSSPDTCTPETARTTRTTGGRMTAAIGGLICWGETAFRQVLR